jgi:hypothetical protein
MSRFPIAIRLAATMTALARGVMAIATLKRSQISHIPISLSKGKHYRFWLVQLLRN